MRNFKRGALFSALSQTSKSACSATLTPMATEEFQEKIDQRCVRAPKAMRVNVLKVELGKESPDVWKRVKSQLLEQDGELDPDILDTL